MLMPSLAILLTTFSKNHAQNNGLGVHFRTSAPWSVATLEPSLREKKASRCAAHHFFSLSASLGEELCRPIIFGPGP